MYSWNRHTHTVSFTVSRPRAAMPRYKPSFIKLLTKETTYRSKGAHDEHVDEEGNTHGNGCIYGDIVHS